MFLASLAQKPYTILLRALPFVKSGILGWVLEVTDVLELLEVKSAADVLAESLSHWRYLTRPPSVVSGG